MYGYIIPDKPNLLMKDYTLYRAFYCGACVCIGKDYGQIPRLTTNYDITFLSLLFHDYTGQPVEFLEKGCILSPLKKKSIAQKNVLMEKIVASNLILAYLNLKDDVIDDGGLKKRAAKRALSRHYKKAKKALPGTAEKCEALYDKLRTLEKAGRSGIDEVSDPFSEMMAVLASDILEAYERETPAPEACGPVLPESGKLPDESGDDFFSPRKSRKEYLLDIAANIGKWVYLIDALDDYDEDKKRGNYNPFLASFGAPSKKQLLEERREKIEFALYGAIGRVIESYNLLDMHRCRGALENIIYYGLKAKTAEVLDSGKKTKPSKI